MGNGGEGEREGGEGIGLDWYGAVVGYGGVVRCGGVGVGSSGVESVMFGVLVGFKWWGSVRMWGSVGCSGVR